MLGKQLAQRLQNIVRLKPASHHDRQALPAVLIQHRQHLERPSIMRPVRHEVIRPYMVSVQGPQSDTRTVGQPQPSSFRLLTWHLEPLLSPDPLHPLVVHGPALRPQHPGHHPVPVAPEPASHLHHVLSQRLLIFPSLRYPTLRRACLAQHPARLALTHPKPLAYLHHAASAPLGA